MKVCTDACILGSYTASLLKKPGYHFKKILDIGSGTGLLSLMLAQKSDALIESIEIDFQSYQQAATNFTLSKWKERLHIVNTNIKTFYPRIKYDLIISNPPFYEHDLISPDEKKNIAKHNAGLTIVDLLETAQRNLTAAGHLSVLLPFHRIIEFKTLATHYNLSLCSELLIKHSIEHDVTRCILIFGKQMEKFYSQDLVIYNTLNMYSTEFISLLKDYYLYL